MTDSSLSFTEARELVREHALVNDAERVAVSEAVGRVLHEEVVSPVDHPGFTNSAMDGYAVRAEDLPGALWMVGESQAGAAWDGVLEPQKAARISTGAPLPEGADAVLRLEDASESGGWVTAKHAISPGTFVRRRGEVVGAGDVILPEGAMIRAHDITALAGLGIARVSCRVAPKVAVVVTGDELVEAGSPRSIGQVYDGNRPGLSAQIVRAGAEVVATQIARDDRDESLRVLSEVLDAEDERRPDLVITAGGVSVGRHDHVRPALLELGVEQVFWGVDIKPGHPLLLGRRGDQRVLALPGNPVSAAVCFHIFGRELLGIRAKEFPRAPISRAYEPTTPRTEFIRCRWAAGELRPSTNQDSHAIGDLAGSDALAVIPANSEVVRSGALVEYLALD